MNPWDFGLLPGRVTVTTSACSSRSPLFIVFKGRTALRQQLVFPGSLFGGSFVVVVAFQAGVKTGRPGWCENEHE